MSDEARPVLEADVVARAIPDENEVVAGSPSTSGESQDATSLDVSQIPPDGNLRELLDYIGSKLGVEIDLESLNPTPSDITLGGKPLTERYVIGGVVVEFLNIDLTQGAKSDSFNEITEPVFQQVADSLQMPIIELSLGMKCVVYSETSDPNRFSQELALQMKADENYTYIVEDHGEMILPNQVE